MTDFGNKDPIQVIPPPSYSQELEEKIAEEQDPLVKKFLSETSANQLKDIRARLKGSGDDISLEMLLWLLAEERRLTMEDKIESETNILKKDKNKMAFLHQMMQAIATASDKEGNFNTSNLNVSNLEKAYNNTDPNSSGSGSNKENPANWDKFVKAAKEMGVEVPAGSQQPDGSFIFTRDEKNELIEAIKLTNEDLNNNYNQGFQRVTTFRNELNEAFQIARAIFKKLDDIKMSILTKMYKTQ